MDNYGIQVASTLSGIGVHTIRKWEQRYGAVSPRRDTNGRRSYTEKDIEKLQLLFELCSIGHTIGKIANLDINELKGLLKKIGNRKFESRVEVELTPTINPEEVRRNLFMALELYKLDIPLLVLWGKQGVVHNCFNPLEEWQLVANEVVGEALPCGHYIAEAAPQTLLECALPFLSKNGH